jgi:hypothetical protein
MVFINVPFFVIVGAVAILIGLIVYSLTKTGRKNSN